MAELKNTSIAGSLQLPVGTNANRPSAPPNGAMRFNTDIGYTEYFRDYYWADLSNGRGMPVTNGLMLALDASNPNSYNGSGTTWFDISGNGYQATMRNLSSGNWVTKNNIRCFETNDTNNQGFSIASFPFPMAQRTYEIWINSKSFGIGWQTWFDDNATERVLFGTSTNTVHVYPSLNFTANLQTDVWYSLAYIMDDSGQYTRAYVNGLELGTGTYNEVGARPSTGTLYILGDPGSEITSCYCAAAFVYNRVLSNDELQQNACALHERLNRAY